MNLTRENDRLETKVRGGGAEGTGGRTGGGTGGGRGGQGGQVRGQVGAGDRGEGGTGGVQTGDRWVGQKREGGTGEQVRETALSLWRWRRARPEGRRGHSE